jgi:uncharacterized protein YndB with AHSA1/START domain
LDRALAAHTFGQGRAPVLFQLMSDGSEHPLKGVYREIVPNERLIYTECYDMPASEAPNGSLRLPLKKSTAKRN